jgi:hypothetical protein
MQARRLLADLPGRQSTFSLREQIKRVSDGFDPMNVMRDERLKRAIPINAWNTILWSAEASMLQGRGCFEGYGSLVFWTAIRDRAIVGQNERGTGHARQPAQHDRLGRTALPGPH